MGRQKVDKDRPFRFIINYSKATANNAYHNLYPNIFLQQIFENTPEMIRVIGQALQAISAEILINEGRVYGGGLHKMEPKELANVPADIVLSKLKNYQGLIPVFDKEKVANQSLWAYEE